MALTFLPIEAADRFIVGYLHSIAVRSSKMQDQKSLMLSVDALMTLILGHGNDLVVGIFA